MYCRRGHGSLYIRICAVYIRMSCSCSASVDIRASVLLHRRTKHVTVGCFLASIESVSKNLYMLNLYPFDCNAFLCPYSVPSKTPFFPAKAHALGGGKLLLRLSEFAPLPPPRIFIPSRNCLNVVLPSPENF